jgi:rhodanese-related sulfurtransferase
MIRTVTREELQHLVRNDEVVLLEALPPLYFDTEHLPGAQNLPLDEVETLAPKIVPDKTTPIVIYCTGLTCPNSKIAATRLHALGYTDVRAYEAGKEDWISAGLPVQSTAAVA